LEPSKNGVSDMADRERRTSYRWVALAWTCIAIAAAPARAEQPPLVDFAQQDGKIDITVGGKPVAAYVYNDPVITRPYFAHVHAPSGVQVTRHHPPVAGEDRPDHPTFHPGIWMSFGDISGNDYWRLKARTVHDVITSEPRGGPGSGSYAVRNRYLDKDDPNTTVCAEDCVYTVLARPAGTLLIWDSTFSSDHEFSFGDQEEMGLGVRVATPIRVEVGDGKLPPGNGTMTDSQGRKNGAEIGGNTADWCDYSGTLEGQRVGMTVFCHPDNFRPSWFHARDYGFLAANAFGRAAFKKGEPSKVVVHPGEKFRLRYGVLVHSERSGDDLDLAAAYEDYVKQAGK
jgi:methane monooxygenase PmoA-like